MQRFARSAFVFISVQLATVPLLAVDLLYDFEGDSGRTVTDKLTVDGGQDGQIFQQVSFTDVGVPFGEQAALFEPPVEPPPPPRDEDFSTIEIPGTETLGEAFTLAAFVNYSNTGFTRIFSSYGGTGAVGPGRIILDIDPSGTVIPGVRFLLAGDAANSITLPVELAEPGWKHFAVTYLNGEVSVYLNGVELAMDNNLFAGGAVVAPVNLRFGEDPHDQGGTANEQFLGNVDDLLVLGRALAPAEIADIANGGVDGNVEAGGSTPAVFYDFEAPDSGATISDRFTEDGAQNGIVVNEVAVDAEESHPLFGAQSAQLSEVRPSEPFSKILIPGTTELGLEWTIAAFVEYENTGLTRLFSSFQGTGAPGEGRILLDIDPSGSLINGVRLIVSGTIAQALELPAVLAEPGWKHVAATYFDGEVAVYINGEEVSLDTNFLSQGAIIGPVDLRFGEDPHDGGGEADEQFRGNVDDLLVVGEALSDADIADIADSGVEGNFSPSGGLAVFYDFEAPDSGTTISDRFTDDGAQDGVVIDDVVIDDQVSHPLFGAQSAKVAGDTGVIVEDVLFSIIEVGSVGNLGSAFTMAATINVPGGGHPFGGLTRLFSTFGGTGSAAGRLVFDFDPNASVEGIGIRLLLPDGTAVVSSDTFTVNEDHHLAAVYEDGDVFLYLDGALVASGISGGGDVDLGEFPLRIGEDVGGIVNENFVGILDEVVVLSEALSDADIASLAENGFTGLEGEPPVAEAGPNAVGAVGAAVSLDGSASSDPDEGPDELVFLWSFATLPEGSALTDEDIADRQTAMASFVPDVAGDYVVRLEVDDGQFAATDTVTIAVTGGDGVGPFVRGDCNQDAERNLTDGIFLLNFLFLGGGEPQCVAACDNNGDGELNITTAVFLFNFLFLGGPPPPEPLECGASSTEDDRASGCENPAGCAV